MGWAAAASLIATGASTGMSFYQASEQKKKQKEAEAAASLAMQEAKKKLDLNFYKGLGINKEPYELEREAVLSNQASLIQAGVESKRGVAAVAGAINMANNVDQRNIAGAMGKDLYGLNKLVADENQNLNNQKVDLDLGTARGAQLAARQNETFANQSLMQGFEGVTSLTGQLASMPSLYGNSKVNGSDLPGYGEAGNPTPAQQQVNAEQATIAPIEQKYNSVLQNPALDANYRKLVIDANGNPVPFGQAFKESGMTYQQFNEFLDTLITQ